MSDGAICKICMDNPSISSIGGIEYCQDCATKYHRLIAGIESHTSSSFRLSQKKVETITGFTPYEDRFLVPLDWYNIPGLHETPHLTTPVPSNSTDELMENLRNVVECLGVKNTLTYLSSIRLLSDFGASDSFTDKDVGLPPRMLEFAIALIGSFSINGTQTKQTYNNYWERLEDMYSLSDIYLAGGYRSVHHRVFGPEALEISTTLECLYTKFNDSYDEFGEKPFQDDNSLAAAAQNSDLIYRNYAYPEQYIESMERRYTPYQYDFLTNKGLDMVKSVDWASELLDECDNRLRRVYQEARYYQFDCLKLIGGIQEAVQNGDQLIDYLESPRHIALQRGELESWATFMTTAENCFWISEDEIRTKLALYNQNRVDTFLKHISISAGDYHVENPFGFNQLESTPLIELDGEYLLAHPRMFARALSKTFFYDLLEMESQNDMRLEIKRRGDFLEQWVYDRISQLFIDGGEHVFINVEWDDEDPEIDVLAKSDSVALVIEAKSKFLTDKARKGSVEDIKKDLNEGILKAVDQLNTITNLLESGELLFSESTSQIPFDNSEIDEYIPIVVMGGEYDRIATMDYVTQIDDETLIPHVLSIYDLDIISRILNTEHFIKYARKRSDIAEKGQLVSMDEMDFLGVYSKTGPNMYDGFPAGDLLEESAETEILNFMGFITGSDRRIRQLLTEFEYKYPTRWLPESRDGSPPTSS